MFSAIGRPIKPSPMNPSVLPSRAPISELPKILFRSGTQAVPVDSRDIGHRIYQRGVFHLWWALVLHVMSATHGTDRVDDKSTS